MTAALEGDEWSAARPGRTLPPGKMMWVVDFWKICVAISCASIVYSCAQSLFLFHIHWLSLPPFIIIDLHSHLSHQSLLYFWWFRFLQFSEI
jgi:hypothetical protein